MAVNCCESPTEIIEVIGVTAILTIVAGPTVRVVEELTPPSVAVMLAVPTPEVVASPCEPAWLPMTATVAGEALQVTIAVRLPDDPSVYVPVAVNCWDLPRSTLGTDGAILIETRTAGVIVKVAVPEIEPEAAVMVVEPVASDCASPAVPGDTLMVATAGFDDVHCTEEVRSCVELSL